MKVLDVVKAPDNMLLKKSTPVDIVDNKIRDFMQDMLATMYDGHGVGLAAIQVGVAKQIIVIDLQDDDDDSERPDNFYPLYIINPKITWASDELNTALEACLSVPECKIEVARPSALKLEYLNHFGEYQTLEADGWLARVIQHEMDHLNGVLIIDHASKLKKDLALAKLQKLKKQLI